MCIRDSYYLLKVKSDKLNSVWLKYDQTETTLETTSHEQDHDLDRADMENTVDFMKAKIQRKHLRIESE